MKRAVQLSLPELQKQYEHGGDILKGRRKSKRPFDRKRPLHLVFRSDMAKGKHSFLVPRNKKIIREFLLFCSIKWGIKLYDSSINANHIHLLVKAADRKGLQGFLRQLPGNIAQAITEAKKGVKLSERFWSKRVYSRIVEWGRAFNQVRKYILQNTLESLGLIPYQERKRYKTKRLN